MKRRILSVLLTLAMVLTFLPAAALAASGSGEVPAFSDWRKVWLYTCTADQDPTGMTVYTSADEREEQPAPPEAGEGQNIREIPGTLIYDLGAVSPDGTGADPLTLTFQNAAEETSSRPDQQKYEQSWGEVNVTSSRETAHFTVTWNNTHGDYGALPEKDDTCTAVIAPKKGLPGGTYTDWVLFMEQNSRVGWAVQVTVTVEREKKTVHPAAQVSKPYGKRLQPSDIRYTVEGTDETGNLSQLGVSITSLDGVALDAPAGSYTLNYPEKVETPDREITIVGTTQLTVEKATPERSSVSVYQIGDDTTLAGYGIGGKYVNPYTRQEVKGTFAWKDPTTAVEKDGAQPYRYIFTPSDDNHEQVEDTVQVRKGASTSMGPSPSCVPVTVTVDEDSRVQEYRGQGARLKISYDINVPADLAKKWTSVWYNAGQGWEQSAPYNAGDYDVMIRFPGGYDSATRANYAGISVNTTLTITPREATPVVSVYSHAFDGTGETQIDSFGFEQKDLSLADADTGAAITRQNVNDYFTACFDDVNAGSGKPVTVTLREGKRVKLTGDNAGNYYLPEKITTTGDITARSLALALNSGVTKYYGQTMTFVASDFTSSSQFYNGDVLESIQLSADSDGAKATADVDSYAVTASSGSVNYTVTGVTGEMAVKKAVPVPVSVSAAMGSIGKTADTIEASLQGAFVNPYSGEAVPGTVKLAAGQGAEKLAEETELTYVFTPSDPRNHTEYVGAVTVTSIRATPAPIQIAGQTAFVYDGKTHPVSPVAVTGVVYTVSYNGQDQAPADVGVYPVNIQAAAGADTEYANSQMDATLVITPATPTVTVEPMEVEQGTVLGEVKPTYTATGVDGEAVSGALTWDPIGGVSAGEIAVTEGAGYNWTFTPDSDNYAAVIGSAVICSVQTTPDPGETDPGTTPDTGETDPSTTPDTGETDPGTTTPGETTGGNTGETNPGTTTPSTGETTPGTTTPGTGETAPGTTTPGTSETTPGETTGGTTGGNIGNTGTTGGTTGSTGGTTGGSTGGSGGSGGSSGGSGGSSGGNSGGGTPAGSGAAETPAAQPAVAASQTFGDVEKGGWYEAGVTFVVSKGLFNGVGANQFAPQQNMTRAMLMTVLARLDGQSTDGGAAWYSKGMDWAKAQGVSDGADPDGSVTREQLVTMLYRYAKSPAVDEAMGMAGYEDVSAVSDWAQAAMRWAVQNGIVTGKDGARLDPQGTATRAEVATILQRYVELVKA